jgi:hypothetical protein
MRKFYLLCLSVFLLQSCTTPSYVFKEPSQMGLDFTKGKWLLHNVDNKYINEQAIKDFKEFTGNRLGETSTASGLLVTNNVPFQPDKQLLTDLYNGTGYDYFINIRDEIIRDDIAAVEIGTNNIQSESSAGVTLEVYDLKNKSIIYSQTVVGNSQKNQSDIGDVNFYKPAASLVIGSYNRIIKDIRSKSKVK